MILAAMRAMVDRLEAGGVRAGLDAADLAPPAVLVHPPALAYQFGGTTAEATWTLVAAVPDTGTLALVELSDLVELTRAALGCEVTAAVPATATMTEGPPVPAYRLTLTTDIGE